MRTFAWEQVTEVCVAGGWIEVASGTLEVDGIRIDAVPTRVVMFDDVEGRHNVVPLGAVHGWRIAGELEQWIDPHKVAHAYSGADGALPSASPRYAPSHLETTR